MKTWRCLGTGCRVGIRSVAEYEVQFEFEFRVNCRVDSGFFSACLQLLMRINHDRCQN